MGRRRRRGAAAVGARGRPLRVLLSTRTHRRVDGGIGRSAKLIEAALSHVGDQCRLRSAGEPLVDIPSDTDLVWHYGDFELVEQHIAAAREAGLPVIVNSNYDGLSDRRRAMIDRLERWGDGVYLAVFSHAAERDVRLHRIAERLVALPKTIRVGAQVETTFADRIGICLGEVEKLARARLVRGVDVGEAVAAIRRAVPDAPLFAYNQYGTPATRAPEGVTVEPKMAWDDMQRFLGDKRLFVSLVAHETFAMVPAEAQAAGTPVIYRDMVQSLTEHFGATAVPFTSLDELEEMVWTLYNTASHWERLSAAGSLNARAKSTPRVGSAISLALRRLLARHRSRGG